MSPLASVDHDACFDRGKLEEFFMQLNAPQSKSGNIVRAKGVFRIGDSFNLMELGLR